MKLDKPEGKFIMKIFRVIAFGMVVLMSVNELEAQTAPLADGLDKWLGSAYSGSQFRNHELYWNQVTPENAGKWGSVEPARDQMNWTAMDDAYLHAREYDAAIRFHVLVWGSQQPGWIAGLPPAEQLEEIREWFETVASRYRRIDYLEVVNEPLHQPPDGRDGAGNYVEALGGSGDTGWDWVITAFEMAREIFPASTKLIINDYGILSDLNAAGRYREIIELLQERDLIDGIAVQGHAFNTRPGSFKGEQVLDFLAETGLPIQVAEMDVDGNPNSDPNVSDEQSDQNQLNDMQRIFPVLWEHEAVEGITFWGWRPGLWRQSQEAYLIRSDGSERPAMEWLREYLEDYRSRILSSEPESGVPQSARLVGSYPNPFERSTRIEYTVAEPAHVTVKIFDVWGRKVATLVDALKTPGDYSVTFDAGDLASGMYVYRLQAGSLAETGSMVRLTPR